MTDYRAFARSMNRDEFVERFPHPFLLVTRDHTSDATREFQTRDISALELENGRPKRTQTEAFLVNREGSAANSMVTVGRATNMDIVLSSPSVSKLHAYFQRNIDGSGWTFADAGSRNGTVLNGQLLAHKSNEPVKSGDIIVFAKIFRAEFLDPAQAYVQLSAS
ncbi:MAG: FHA domain-containing protein [Myxococcota bacterium]